MRKLLAILSLFICCQALAQEVLSPLGFNPRLFYSTAQSQKTSHPGRYKSFVIVEDSTILVESDTLSLPFVDDFTHPSLKPYNYSGYIYDTIYNAIGPCITDTAWTVRTVTDTFSFNPTFTYKYDTTAKKVDTIPNAPILFLNSPGFSGNCFYAGDSAMLYPLSYVDIFDSLTGTLAAQFRDTSNVRVAITYAPVLYKSKMPAYTKWLDNNAYQNFTSAYLPPSIGVATLDGLNSFGQPYNKSNPINWGMADVLTSKPLDLSNLTDADSTYLSFFYQPGGFGDVPTINDSLVLQFYNGYTNNWDEIWSVAGDSVVPNTPDAFRQKIFRIPSTSNSPPINYMFKGFQFRILNYGSLTGNNDIWNIDYVRLDKNRSVNDTSINDLAFQYQFPSILKNYSEMPAEQFTGNADLADTIPFYIDNLNPGQAQSNPPATPYTITSNQTFPAVSVVLAPTTNTFNAGLENMVLLSPSAQYTSPTIGTDTLVVINSQAVINNTDILMANDTINHSQILYNTLAYDDGSAEMAYGLQNLGTNKFAYDFTLNKPDSLVGFQVLFTNIDVAVNDLVFTYNLWYHLDTQNVFYTDTPIFVSNNYTPYYIDSVNGFTTYKIAPVALPNHFYFGWSQTDVRNLQVGYDMNSPKGRQHMYIYTNGVWHTSTIYTNGSPMIRLLLSRSSQISSGIRTISNEPIKAYPNPTNSLVTFELPASGSFNLELYNMLGQLNLNQTLDSEHNVIDISHFVQGVYLVRLTDIATGVVYQNKIMKSSK